MNNAYLNKDHFALFGIPKLYNLCLTDLRSRYLKLQAQFHPDHYTQQTEQDRQFALAFSTHINSAFQALKDPVLRAQYLLSLLADNPNTLPQPAHLLSNTFLMAQMELREALADLTAQPDASRQLDIKNQIVTALQQYELALTEAFADFPATHETIVQLIAEFQFYQKLNTELKALPMLEA